MPKRPDQPKELTRREQLTLEVRELHATMREQIMASGIHKDEVDAPLKGLDELTTENIESLRDWLSKLQAGAYAGVMATYAQRPQSFWDNLTGLFSQHNTREQKDLKRARRLLRIAWRRRHGQPKATEEKAAVDVDDPENAR